MLQMVRVAVALLLMVLPLLMPWPAHTQTQVPRIALLIGNQTYTKEIGRLANPHNDVALLERALTGLGFDVVIVRDAGLAQLHQAVNAYARRVRAAGARAVGFFYYSGHGAADAGTNYLVPIDAKTTETSELWDQSLRLTEVTRKLKSEAANATHFVVFDACRNTLKLSKAGSRGLVQSKGFVPIVQESGMLIAYATAEGELASDVGAGAGPYAKVLAEEIVKPGVEAVNMFRRVQVRVRSTIGQEPWLGFNALGEVYLAGLNVKAPAPPPSADALAKKAAQASRDFEEGERHYHGRGVPRDYIKARQGYQRAAVAGHAGAMSGLGWLHEKGYGTPKDYAKARAWYEKAAANANTSSMANLARLHREGLGVPQDYAKARELYEKAAAAGNADGLVGLGWLHQHGWGVPLDYAKAREFYEKGVAKGSGAAMNNLGVMHERGLGVAKDSVKAREWYERSAAAGNDFAMNNLGRAFEHGWGAPPDHAKAREWYEKAAAAGNRLAKGNLARLLDQGKGGPIDAARAAKLLLEAARSGNDEIIEMLQGDMQKWTKETRAELKRELARLGHYKGQLGDTWDGRANMAVGRYLGQGG
jgi:TPR repeat protein